MTENNNSSNLPEFYDLILKTRSKVSKLTTGHIPAKDLLTHYILPLFATLHDELDEALEDLAELADGGAPDDDVAAQASAALIALATFAEKTLLDAGIIAREVSAEGVPSVKATDKTPVGLLEQFAVLQTQVVGALNALAEASTDDEDDEDEEGDEDEDDSEDGDEAEAATPEASAV